MIYYHQKKTLTAVPIQPAVKLAPEAVEQRTAACAGCEWNLAWICEHSGCKPCKQRADGGLRSKIERPFETCPAGLW
jgi:hypothetical protein